MFQYVLGINVAKISVGGCKSVGCARYTTIHNLHITCHPVIGYIIRRQRFYFSVSPKLEDIKPLGFWSFDSIQTRIVGFNVVGYNMGFRKWKIWVWDFQTTVFDSELRCV